MKELPLAAYGVMITPALVVDGKVVSYGKALKTDEVMRILERRRGTSPTPLHPKGKLRSISPSSRSIVPPARFMIPPSRSIVPLARFMIPPSRSIVPLARFMIPPSRSIVPLTRSVIPPSRSVIPLRDWIIFSDGLMVFPHSKTEKGREDHVYRIVGSSDYRRAIAIDVKNKNANGL